MTEISVGAERSMVEEIEVGMKRLFESPYEEYAARNGETCTVVKVYDKDDADHDISEVGTMYGIRFESDGAEIDAWPEEIMRAAA